MSGIESPIGKVTLTGNPTKVITMDDPRELQKMQKQLPFNPPTQSQEPVQISPEEYIQYKALLEQRMKEGRLYTAQSTQNVVPEDQKFTPASNDDLELLRTFERPQPGVAPLKSAREMKEKDKRITPEKKNKLEVLMGLKKRVASIEIDGHKITLQNITSLQSNKILSEVAKQTTGLDQVYTTMHMVIGYALKAIDDEELNYDDEEKIKVAGNMAYETLTELYNFYTKEIGTKLSVNSSKAIDEVVEDVKK